MIWLPLSIISFIFVMMLTMTCGLWFTWWLTIFSLLGMTLTLMLSLKKNKSSMMLTDGRSTLSAILSYLITFICRTHLNDISSSPSNMNFPLMPTLTNASFTASFPLLYPMPLIAPMVTYIYEPLLFLTMLYLYLSSPFSSSYVYVILIRLYL